MVFIIGVILIKLSGSRRWPEMLWNQLSTCRYWPLQVSTRNRRPGWRTTRRRRTCKLRRRCRPHRCRHAWAASWNQRPRASFHVPRVSAQQQMILRITNSPMRNVGQRYFCYDSCTWSPTFHYWPCRDVCWGQQRRWSSLQQQIRWRWRPFGVALSKEAGSRPLFAWLLPPTFCLSANLARNTWAPEELNGLVYYLRNKQ